MLFFQNQTLFFKSLYILFFLFLINDRSIVYKLKIVVDRYLSQGKAVKIQIQLLIFFTVINKVNLKINEKKYIFPIIKNYMIKGARFSSLCANIKYKDRLDLTLILLEAGSIVTGVFTNSKTKAPSVIWSKKVVKNASKNEEEPIAI